MKFLFCSLDSPGFLHPLIGVAQALRMRKHQVKFVTNLQHQDHLAGLGFERLPRTASDGVSFQVAQWGDPFSIALQVKHIEHALELFPADILVGQPLTYGPLIVAERRALPVGLLGLCTYLWPTRDDEREIPDISIHCSVEEWRVWRYHGMLERYNRARALFRLPPYPSGCRNTPLLGDLFLLQNVPELEPAWEELPERVHLVGSCLWEPDDSDPELDLWLGEAVCRGIPVIYVQHGRSFHIPGFWRSLVEALADSGYKVAASVGRLDGEIGAVPEGFFVRPHVPQRKILRHARVAVASANTTAVLGALTAGVPSLLLPAGGEQPDVAAMCQSSGTARTLLPQEATPEGIRSGIEVLLDDSRYRERALFYALAFAQRNGAERAADLLEALARTRRPMLTLNAIPLEMPPELNDGKAARAGRL